MSTVPVVAASLLLTHLQTLAGPSQHTCGPADVVARCIRQLGRRPEVDLRAVASECPRLAVELEQILRASRQVWSAVTNQLAGVPYVRTQRQLAQHVQVTAKSGRSDLGDVLEVLTEQAGVGTIVEALTAAEPDLLLVRDLATVFAGKVATLPDGSVELELVLPGVGGLPELLGGPSWPGEVRRRLVVVVRHAAWRDRRVRRLASVTVVAEEVWADPALALRAMAGSGPVSGSAPRPALGPVAGMSAAA